MLKGDVSIFSRERIYARAAFAVEQDVPTQSYCVSEQIVG